MLGAVRSEPLSIGVAPAAPPLSYSEEITKHRSKIQLYDLEPRSNNAFIAPSATVVGEVFMDRFSTVWFNAVIRGDINAVRIGQYSSVGDNTVIHTAASLPTGIPSYVNIGNNVTIYSNCTLYSCTIEDDVVIGPKSVILEGARVEKSAMLAPGSVVPPGRLIPAKQLWGGNPVEYIKDLDIGEVWANYTLSFVHATMGDTVKFEFTPWPSNYLLKESTREDVDVKFEDMVGQLSSKRRSRGNVKRFS